MWYLCSNVISTDLSAQIWRRKSNLGHRRKTGISAQNLHLSSKLRFQPKAKIMCCELTVKHEIFASAQIWDICSHLESRPNLITHDFSGVLCLKQKCWKRWPKKGNRVLRRRNMPRGRGNVVKLSSRSTVISLLKCYIIWPLGTNLTSQIKSRLSTQNDGSRTRKTHNR